MFEVMWFGRNIFQYVFNEPSFLLEFYRPFQTLVNIQFYTLGATTEKEAGLAMQ